MEFPSFPEFKDVSSFGERVGQSAVAFLSPEQERTM